MLIRWLISSLLALTVVGCGGATTAPVAASRVAAPAGPSAEVRQAFAPTGKLRVGLLLHAPPQAIKDPVSGEVKGVGYDLGEALARRLGVPYEPVFYETIGALFDEGKAGKWDVAFAAYNAERAKAWDYTAAHMEVELGFLLPGSSPITTMAEVDRPGIRVAIPERSNPMSLLSEVLKQAVIVPAPNMTEAMEMVKAGKADAMGYVKPSLYELAKQFPGSRIIDSAETERHALLMLKGRELALPFARRFVEDAKAEGVVKAAIARAGLRGVHVAPASP